MQAYEEPTGARHAGWVLPACAGLIAIPLVLAVFAASHWPLVHDELYMHSLTFLMQRGLAPYRDIVDMQMPGTYLLEGLGIRVLGGGAHGWFLWDMAACAGILLGSVWITGAGRRAAGFIAGSLTCLLHLSQGDWNMGQRDWIVAALAMLSFACLMQMVRGGGEAWLGGATFFATLAASVKPPALLFCLLAFGAAAWLRRKQPRELLALSLWALGGAAVPVVAVVLFLAKWHALGAFAKVATGLMPYYASLGKVPFRGLLWHPLTGYERLFVLLALGALLLFVLNRSWRSAEAVLLTLAVAAGAASYAIQDKGFPYHRYPAIAFASLWIALGLEKGLRERDLRAWLAWPLLAFIAVLLPVAVVARPRSHAPEETRLHLEADLERLGGSGLSRRVQCLDMTAGGCLEALYRLGLVPSTGHVYDFYLFPERPTALTASLQQGFLQQVSGDPPEVFVLSEEDWPGGGTGYAQLARWPAFASFLAQHYRMESEFIALSSGDTGYRIYQLR
jgi:hypothetical protein